MDKGTTIRVGNNIDTYDKHPEGKELDYWSDKDGNNARSSSVKIEEDCTFTAVWKPIQVTVCFKTNCSIIIEKQTVKWGDTITEPTIELTREDSEFLGWFHAGEMFDFSTPIQDNYLILEAVWAPEYYTVTFNPDNGESTWQENYISWGYWVDAPTDPVKTGYTFAGWYLDDTEYIFFSPVTKDITLTAHWVDNETTVEGKCVVTYDFNDSSLSNETITVSKWATISVGENINTSDKHPEGKTLDYWEDQYGNEIRHYSEYPDVQIGEDCTFTAVWKPMIVSVYFVLDYNESSLDYNESPYEYSYQQVTWGDVITEPQLTKEGYTFSGWNLYSWDTGKYDFSKGIKPNTSSMHFFPIWTPETCNVTVNANRGKDESTTQAVSYDTVLNLDTPEYDGFRFLGWYDGETKFDVRTTPITKSMTLTAKWEKVKTFNVIFCYLDETATPITKEVAYKQTATEPEEKIIDGLVFEGWYKGDSTFDPFIFINEPFNFSQEITGDVYLYAKYNLKEEKLVGTWRKDNLIYDVKILKEDGKNIIKFKKSPKMIDVGTCDYDEDLGTLKATFAGKFAAWTTGTYAFYYYTAQELKEPRETLTTQTDNGTFYSYKTERTPSSNNVKGKWTREDGHWFSTIEFSETEATVTSLLYSNQGKTGKVISETKLVSKYNFGNIQGYDAVTFVDINTLYGPEDTTASSCTNLTYAVDADTFYAVGFMGFSETPFTRVN